MDCGLGQELYLLLDPLGRIPVVNTVFQVVRLTQRVLFKDARFQLLLNLVIGLFLKV